MLHSSGRGVRFGIHYKCHDSLTATGGPGQGGALRGKFLHRFCHQVTSFEFLITLFSELLFCSEFRFSTFKHATSRMRLQIEVPGKAVASFVKYT